MSDEKITVRVTSTGQTLEVVVFSKRVDVHHGGARRGRPQRALLALPDAQRDGLRRQRDGARDRLRAGRGAGEGRPRARRPVAQVILLAADRHGRIAPRFTVIAPEGLLLCASRPPSKARGATRRRSSRSFPTPRSCATGAGRRSSTSPRRTRSCSRRSPTIEGHEPSPCDRACR